MAKRLLNFSQKTYEEHKTMSECVFEGELKEQNQVRRKWKDQIRVSKIGQNQLN